MTLLPMVLLVGHEQSPCVARIISVCTGKVLPLGETASISVDFQNRHVAQDFDMAFPQIPSRQRRFCSFQNFRLGARHHHMPPAHAAKPIPRKIKISTAAPLSGSLELGDHVSAVRATFDCDFIFLPPRGGPQFVQKDPLAVLLDKASAKAAG